MSGQRNDAIWRPKEGFATERQFTTKAGVTYTIPIGCCNVCFIKWGLNLPNTKATPQCLQWARACLGFPQDHLIRMPDGGKLTDREYLLMVDLHSAKYEAARHGRKFDLQKFILSIRKKPSLPSS